VVCRRGFRRSRTPSWILTAGEHARVTAVEVTRPFCAAALIAYLRVRAISGVERVEGLRYFRTLRGGGGVLAVDLRDADRNGIVYASYSSRSECDEEFLRKSVVHLVDADAPVSEVALVLKRDPTLGSLVQQWPGVRIPGTVAPFELAVRAILGQQVSVAAATTLASRVAHNWGSEIAVPSEGLTHTFPEIDHLIEAELEAVGLSRAKATAIRHLAQAVKEDRVNLTPVEVGGRAEQKTLLAIPGVGPWTAAYISLRGLRDRDSIPTGDLGLQRAAGCASPAELVAAAERWRPWRGYAAVHLWGTYLPIEPL
jgi:AraC family transcriptional regulator, regulatory protein of adaptative response / DNA-3-methyladenine glycosylase II